MKRIFLDLETLPDGTPDYSECVDPASIVVMHDDERIKPDKRLKDPEKVAADVEKKRAALQAKLREEAAAARQAVTDFWERGSLNPMRGRILCVSICSDDRPPTVIMEDTERETLETLEGMLLAVEAKGHRPLITTWNGAGFDLPYLVRRALRWGLTDLARIVHKKKMRFHPGDLMNVWKMDQPSKKPKKDEPREPLAKLDDVCAFLGIPRHENPIDGSEVLPRYLAGDLEAIKQHAAADVDDLRKVCRILEAAGMC